ncbi:MULTISPECIES: acyl-CoA dehydratase activase [unclassified Paludibacterium]|uniref:acyl-CoA dehydratase activase n=1 Tax=unclassified Paludibacterium TaxID=2618429 RepID=UPI001C03D023|nr:acyl-CoA dehydratase activase [Paludibacterium sp. B53371]BEV72491.1 acyl-CoA dehydratase activase [Paludibacterium sp. THUN1379]
MRTAGIDIGSRTVKLVILEDGQPVLHRVMENTFEPLAVCRQLLQDQHFDAIAATGYGRRLFAGQLGGEVITEIRAAALGARHCFPDCCTVLDIGGQDTKAISLGADGHVGQFEMNDKCAAGTGRFFEVLAMSLGCTLNEFGELALAGQEGPGHVINSTCTVFAESEVVSLIARGCRREEIARGIVDAVASRAAALVRRISPVSPLVFIGGLAHCHALRQALTQRLDMPVLIPPQRQTVVALGAALAAEASIQTRRSGKAQTDRNDVFGTTNSAT